MRELGPPVAYLVVRAGTPVYDHGGDRVGQVEHVLADEPSDIFHGLIVLTDAGRHHVYADADQIAELHEQGVLLSAGAPLHELDERAGQAIVEDLQEDKLQIRLREAREWLGR